MSQHNDNENAPVVSLEKKSALDYLALLSVIVASAIVPLIVLMKAVRLEGILFEAWNGKEVISDFFSYYKSRVLLACLVALLIYLLIRIFMGRGIELPKLFLPLGIYTVMVMLSALLAEHKIVALYGFVERYEGLFSILCYIALAIVAFLTIKNKRRLKVVLFAVFASMTLLAILGLTQFYDMDFFQTPLGKKLILPKIHEHLADGLYFTFAKQKIMYTTVYNPNYLGSYSALLFPVALGLCFSWIEKGGWRFILALIFTLASFVLFLGGMSRAGILGGLAALVLFVLFFRKRIKKNVVRSGIILILLAGVYITMDLTSGGAVTREFISTLPTAQEMGMADGSHDGKVMVKNIELCGHDLYFETETEGLLIGYDSTVPDFYAYDQQGRELTFVVSESTYSFKDEAYKDFKVIELSDGVNLLGKDWTLQFRIEDGGFKFLTEEGTMEDPMNASSSGIRILEAKGKSLTLEAESIRLNLVHNESGFAYYNAQGLKLDKILTEAKFTFADEQYKDYAIIPNKGWFYLIWNDYKLPFVVHEDKLLFMVKTGVYIDKFDRPETFGFKGRELFASGRGYIWSRSIPMLKNTLLIGNGPDTYAIYFPQNEIDSKMNFLNSSSRIVDKPHSWYLQMGIDTGVISLAAMLVFLAWYWLKGFAVFIKDVDGAERTLGAAILCGVTGYLIAALFNDSTVSVAPVFWTLLGSGIAILYRCVPGSVSGPVQAPHSEDCSNS